MVIAFVGAGSYVFGPSALVRLLELERSGIELRLIDPALEDVEMLAAAVARESAANGRPIRTTCHAGFEDSLAGADFVLHSAAPGMREGFVRSQKTLAEIYPDHPITEFGGVHGIAYSVTQVRFMHELGLAMLKQCPNAVLLTVANPLPRVCEAARQLGIKALGFCSVSQCAYGAVLRLLEGAIEAYPFAEAKAKYRLEIGGTNHLSWVTKAAERASGQDVMPGIRRHGDEHSPSKIMRYLARTGCLLAPGEDHIHDFFPPEGIEPKLETTSHGDNGERANRRAALSEAAQGSRSLKSLDLHPAWEDPVGVMHALAGGPPVRVPSLNAPNSGQISALPMGAIVETPAAVDASGVHPEAFDLPEPAAIHNRVAVVLTGLIVKAALEGDEPSLIAAVDADPLIVNKSRGLAALKACLGRT